MLNNFRTYFIAKILLYFLNAVNDAYLAHELAKHLRGEEYQSNQRIKSFIKHAAEDRDQLIGVIYTLYFMNGFYDYMFAKWLLRFIPEKGRYEIMQQLDSICRTYGLVPYQEFYWEDVVLVTPLLKLALGRLPYNTEFMDIFRLKLPKSIRKTAKSMIVVQKVNIESNYANVEYLKQLWNKGKVAKIKKLELIAGLIKALPEETARITVNSMINTLKAASRWDKLFVLLLRFRFWV